MRQDLEQLKRHFPLLDYLRRNHWKARRAGTSAEFVGLCPLHRETQPSFYVNARKNLFYCHGCGHGGDLIRFIEWSQRLSFRQSVAYLQEQIPAPDGNVLLEKTAAKPLVDSVFPFDQLLDAFERLRQGPMGKVLLRVS